MDTDDKLAKNEREEDSWVNNEETDLIAKTVEDFRRGKRRRMHHHRCRTGTHWEAFCMHAALFGLEHIHTLGMHWDRCHGGFGVQGALA